MVLRAYCRPCKQNTAGSGSNVNAMRSLFLGAHAAAVAYGTSDGGVIGSQAPAGNGNNNLEPGEFLRIPVRAVADAKLNGTYDILDAARSFAVEQTRLDTLNRRILRWPVVPGQAYQVQSRSALDSRSWLPGPTQTAGSAQWEMEFTDTNAAVPPMFYRVIRP